MMITNFVCAFMSHGEKSFNTFGCTNPIAPASCPSAMGLERDAVGAADFFNN